MRTDDLIWCRAWAEPLVILAGYDVNFGPHGRKWWSYMVIPQRGR